MWSLTANVSLEVYRLVTGVGHCSTLFWHEVAYNRSHTHISTCHFVRKCSPNIWSEIQSQARAWKRFFPDAQFLRMFSSASKLDTEFHLPSYNNKQERKDKPIPESTSTYYAAEICKIFLSHLQDTYILWYRTHNTNNHFFHLICEQIPLLKSLSLDWILIK